jgi:malate synthase
MKNMNMPALQHSQIHQGFYHFVNEQVLTSVDIEQGNFWQAFEQIIHEFTVLQPTRHCTNGPIAIDTMDKNQKPIVAEIDNKDAIIDALNSRWTSVFNQPTHAKEMLDQRFPLTQGSHTDVKNYVVYYHHLLAFFKDGSQSGLKNPGQFVALCGHKCSPDSILLKESDLHVEIIFDANGVMGRKDQANIQDIQIETNHATIIEFTPTSNMSTQAKIESYKTLMSVMNKTIGGIQKNGAPQKSKRLKHDQTFTDLNGEDYETKATTPCFISHRNSMQTSDMIRSAEGTYAPQDIIDTMMIALISAACRGTENLSIMQAASKMASDIATTNTLYRRIEQTLRNPQNTIKMVLSNH